MVDIKKQETGVRGVNEYSVREHLDFLLKRMVALPSKMIGFKPVCLYLATWLLFAGKIGEWVWFAVLVAVLFGIVGLKLVAQLRSGAASV
mgnify:CR=1 FL=1